MNHVADLIPDDLKWEVTDGSSYSTTIHCPYCGVKATLPISNDDRNVVCSACRKEFRSNTLLALYERKIREYRRLINFMAGKRSEQEPKQPAQPVAGQATAAAPRAGKAAEIPTLADVGGMKAEKAQFIEAVRFSLLEPGIFEHLGLKPVRGILLEGPPGCGKTHLVRALGGEFGIQVTCVNGPEFIIKWVGESEQNLRKIFEDAQKQAPAIIVFDEIDCFAFKRQMASSSWERTLVNQFLTLMDGIKQQARVLVVGTTNCAEMIDPALTRPGRFDHVIRVDPPSVDELVEILGVHTRNMPLETPYDFHRVAGRMNGMTGADVVYICREAGLMVAREHGYTRRSTSYGSASAISAIEVAEAHFHRAIDNYQAARKAKGTRAIGYLRPAEGAADGAVRQPSEFAGE